MRKPTPPPQPFSAKRNVAWRALLQAAGENDLELRTLAQAKGFRKLAVYHHDGDDTVFVSIVMAEDLGQDKGVAVYGACCTFNPQFDVQNPIEAWAASTRAQAEAKRRARGAYVGGEELDPEEEDR